MIMINTLDMKLLAILKHLSIHMTDESIFEITVYDND